MVSEHVGPQAGDTAQGVHVAELSAVLSKLGHEVTVYTRREGPGLPERIRADGGYDVVHVTAGPARRLGVEDVVPHLGAFAEALAEEWERRPPDVVHAHRWTAGLAAVIGAHRAEVPLVHSCHGLAPRPGHRTGQDSAWPRRAETEALLARTASRIIAAGSSEVSELCRLGAQRARISVVPGGVDLELFHPDGPVAERGPLRRVLAVGELVPRNGYHEIITAMSTMDDAELVIVGDSPRADPATDQLHALIDESEMRKRVVCTGAVPRGEMPALLRSADVVVCAPWREPLGTVALEAMACGVPVVATEVGVLPDIVLHQVTGLHVLPRNVRALTRALRSLLANETQREQFGIAGRDRVVARYSWDRLAREFLSGYQHTAALGSRHDVAHDG